MTVQDLPHVPLQEGASGLLPLTQIQAEHRHSENRIGARSPNTADILADDRRSRRGIDFWVLGHPVFGMQQNGGVEGHLSILHYEKLGKRTSARWSEDGK